jgi:hypothetical protein
MGTPENTPTQGSNKKNEEEDTQIEQNDNHNTRDTGEGIRNTPEKAPTQAK